MVVLPAAAAATSPVDELTVATDELLLVQVPPAAPDDDRVRLVGADTVCSVNAPVLLVSVPGLRPALTVTCVLREQPVAVMVYVMLVVPEDTPVITPLPAEPELPMVATDTSLLLQVPAPVVVVIEAVSGIHTDVVPPNAAGIGLAENGAVTRQLPNE